MSKALYEALKKYLDEELLPDPIFKVRVMLYSGDKPVYDVSDVIIPAIDWSKVQTTHFLYWKEGNMSENDDATAQEIATSEQAVRDAIEDQKEAKEKGK
jgi:hypothetical protein